MTRADAIRNTLKVVLDMSTDERIAQWLLNFTVTIKALVPAGIMKAWKTAVPMRNILPAFCVSCRGSTQKDDNASEPRGVIRGIPSGAWWLF